MATVFILGPMYSMESVSPGSFFFLVPNNILTLFDDFVAVTFLLSVSRSLNS